MKRCTQCGQYLALERFVRAPGEFDGRNGRCYPCNRAYFRVWLMVPCACGGLRSRRARRCRACRYPDRVLVGRA